MMVVVSMVAVVCATVFETMMVVVSTMAVVLMKVATVMRLRMMMTFCSVEVTMSWPMTLRRALSIFEVTMSEPMNHPRPDPMK